MNRQNYPALRRSITSRQPGKNRAGPNNPVKIGQPHMKLPFSPRSLLSALSAFCLIAYSAIAEGATVGAAERLVICYVGTHSALVPLAKLRGFYAAEGLNVEVRRFPSGVQTLKAMFSGECTLATAAENPVVHHSLRNNDLTIIAAVSISNNIESVLVRSDRGILAPADLRGRRIAVPEFTNAHYFLDIFLMANGLAPQEAIKVYLPAQEVAPAFRRGEVDAAAHWKPNLQALAAEFGTRAKTFDAPGLHINPMLLVGGRDTVRKKPAAIERVLRALLRAERHAREQPASARALMARNYEITQSEIDLVWPLHDFRLSLGQSLPFILENAARWEIGLLPPATVDQRPALPNYLDFIYFDGLMAVKPDAVTIIH